MAEDAGAGAARSTATVSRVTRGRPPVGAGSPFDSPHRRRTIRRGTLICALVLLVIAAGAVVTTHAADRMAAAEPAAAAPVVPGLRTFAPGHVRIGTAVDGRLLDADPRYSSLLTSNFSAVTAENAMKWAVMEPRQGAYNWVPADQVVDFATVNGQAVYGHTLVWHTSVPSWVTDSWSRTDLRALLRTHITTVVSRYRGKVWAWDVVNEALDDDGSLRDTIWLRKLGPGYIKDAFRWAHEADPDARLFINDYGTEGRTRKADALYRLVRELRAGGVPVHGVGFQGHLRWDRSPKDATGNLRRFARLGVSVAITELDVRIDLPVTAEKLAAQALLYQHMLKACLAVSTCESFTLWGFLDSYSWIDGHFPGYGAACVYDSQWQPKPAYQALTDELRRRFAPNK